ncbi:MAG: adenylyl-sulfate kinase [Flavobacteriales bacterium]|mgnify:FL=1|jgi:adenylylsulfate kinase|tara:strand:- start:44 stop:652 length:609 start_codon:yes stop_codon:yes gene_type:complete
MKESKENIFTIFDDILQREDKEAFLNQRSMVIWMTGLSGSGKTTVAKGVERYLHSQGVLNQLLDGDNIRVGISNNLTFSSEDRGENIRRIAEVSKLFMNCGIVTLNCFVSPTKKVRQVAKDIIGEKNFVEVYINASISTCEKRDVKGLYKKARKGEIKDFTGISAPFEAPENPELEINTSELSIEESVQKVLDYILPKIKNK